MNNNLKFYSLLTLSFLILMSSCNNDEVDGLKSKNQVLQDQLNSAKEDIKLLVLKDILIQNTIHDNLIKSTEGDSAAGYRVGFENGENLIVPPGLVNNLLFDSINWKSKFFFADSSTAIYNSIGTLIIPYDSVFLNPYGVSPLSALVRFSTPIPGRINVVVKGKNGNPTDVSHTFDAFGTSHEAPILGLYPSFENVVEINFLRKDGEVRGSQILAITTGQLPEGLPTSITVTVRKEDRMASGMTLISYLGGKVPNSPFLIDNYGDVRWLLDFGGDPELKTLRYNNGVERLHNGNLYFGDQSLSKIYEIDMLGKIINKFTLTGYKFHHQVQEKPDRNFIVTANKVGSLHLNGKPTIEDYVIEIDRKSGVVIMEWDLKQSLDEWRTTWIDDLDNDPVDWFHGNAVTYDPNDNTIIVSGRTQGVVKLNYNNEVQWILAPHKEWGLNRKGQDLNQFLLNPLDQSGNLINDQQILDGELNHPHFEWNWYQHATLVMPNGNLMLFDNGDNRNYIGTEKYSRAVEFQINELNMTVKQIWSFGKELGLAAYSRVVSDVDYLPQSDNVLFVPGFQVNNLDGLGGKVIEIDYLSKEIVFEVMINSSGSAPTHHRAERLPLYPQ